MKKIIIPLIVCAGLAGCAHVTPQAASMNFSPEGMEIVGPAKGESGDKGSAAACGIQI